MTIRRRVGLATVALAAALAGCGTPAPVDPLPLLQAWEMSATLGVDGTAITATYANWPLPAPPLVFACSSPPDEVFAGPPTHILVVEADPACVPVEVRVADGVLRLRRDRLGLPPSFDGLNAWHIVFAVVADQATWDARTVLPVQFPGIPPLPSVGDPGPS